MYTFSRSELSDFSYLSKLSLLLTSNGIEVFHEMGELDRMSLDGVMTFIGNINGQRVGVISTDFKILGGSFSKRNSLRVCKFINFMQDFRLPIIFNLNSLGVRFIEGRTVFDNAFSILNELYQFRKENLLVTIGLKNVLGIAALIFAQGHYRMALTDETKINLTGPEVHKRFFGRIDTPFDQFTNSTHQFETNTLIHEIHEKQEELYVRVKSILSFLHMNTRETVRHITSSNEIETGSLIIRANEDEILKKLEGQLGESTMELFPQKGAVVRIYIGMIEGHRVGYILNPPMHPNNMLTVNAVDKSLAALELFKVLEIPAVSIVDSPGGDPRKKESDKDAIVKMMNLAHSMIDYPHPKMGIILGRCYGGAAMFSFPEIFGGIKVLAVEGAKVGVINKTIIDELVANSSRMKQNWDLVSSTETADLQDMIDYGTFESVITFDQIKNKIFESVIKSKELLVSEDLSEIGMNS